MPRRRLQARMRSHGIYEAWTGDHKQVPRIIAFTTTVPARVGIEFGYVLHITGGKGERLDFRVEHPPWRRGDGSVEPAFIGSFPVRSNDFEFFLGDTIWEPWQPKCGPWTLITMHGAGEIARLTLELVDPEQATG